MISTGTSYQEKLTILIKLVDEHLAVMPDCHDIDHVLRVRENANLIMELEKDADRQIVETAAILHDIARPEELKSNGKICHALYGAELAIPFLAKSGFTDPVFQQKVSDCIKKHRYRGKLKPETLEECIIYDADKLDSIGAVGIGRAFLFAGRIGAKLHNDKETALTSEAYSREDTAYREYLVKLQDVPSRMLTNAGKKLAEKRESFMHNFFDVLNREVFAGKSS